MAGMTKTLGSTVAACCIVALFARDAVAAAASPWIEDSRAAFRLIAGDNKPGSAVLRAGVEVKLAPGWKTYWRYPGDSGVPPRFDFSRSENLANAKIEYPAPHLFTDDAGYSIGYKDGVIFPLRLTPRQADKPIKLHLKFDYAVCEKICVPAEGAVELTVSAGSSAHEALLAAAEKNVPKPASAGEAGLTARRVNEGAKPLVMVDLKARTGKQVTLFVEGPSPEWALPIPKPAPGAPEGHQQFAFELDGLPPGVNPKGQFDLIFTVVEGEQAYEIKTHLD